MHETKSLPKYNYHEAAQLLKISVPTLRRWISTRNDIPHYKVGIRVFFSEDHIEQILNSMEVKA